MTTIPYNQPMFRVVKSKKHSKERPLNKKQKTQVKRIAHSGQEIKWKDYLQNNIAVSTAGVFNGILDVSQGDASFEREGDSLKWCGNLYLRLTMFNSGGLGADQFNTIRMIIFQFHPNQTPALTDILVPGPFGGNYDYLSQYNHLRRQDYKIIFDKTMRTVLETTESNPYEIVQQKQFVISTKKLRKVVNYYPAAGLAGTNRLYTILLSDSSITPHPSVSYSLRGYFKDS